MKNRLGVRAHKVVCSIAGAVAVAALLALAPLALGQQQDNRLQRTFTVNAGSTLKVTNYKGSIHVTGSNSNQVAVNVWKRFEGGTDAERKWWMENTKINFSNDSGHVEIKVEYPTDSWSCWLCWMGHDNYTAHVELEIQVPTKTNLNLDGYKPDITIASVQGDIRIKSYKAPMTIEATTGAIHIDTYKDTIHLKNVAVRGELDVKSYKAETDIDAKSLDGSTNLETYRGRIVLRVPKDIGLDVDFAGGRRGSFHSDFPMASMVGGRSGAGGRGTVNGGGPHVTLRSERGSVSLEKRAGEL